MAQLAHVHRAPVKGTPTADLRPSSFRQSDNRVSRSFGSPMDATCFWLAVTRLGARQPGLVGVEAMKKPFDFSSFLRLVHANLPWALSVVLLVMKIVNEAANYNDPKLRPQVPA